MISDVYLDFYEAANLLDDIIPGEYWEATLEEMLDGIRNGLPRIEFTVCPNGPIFALSSVATFALKVAKMKSYSAADFIEHILEVYLRKTQVGTPEGEESDIDALIAELTNKRAA